MGKPNILNRITMVNRPKWTITKARVVEWVPLFGIIER